MSSPLNLEESQEPCFETGLGFFFGGGESPPLYPPREYHKVSSSLLHTVADSELVNGTSTFREVVAQEHVVGRNRQQASLKVEHSHACWQSQTITIRSEGG